MTEIHHHDLVPLAVAALDFCLDDRAVVVMTTCRGCNPPRDDQEVEDDDDDEDEGD